MELCELDMRFEGTQDYVATDDLKVAVNAAVLLRRPLLVKGEPGTGKTVLAQEIASANQLTAPRAELLAPKEDDPRRAQIVANINALSGTRQPGYEFRVDDRYDNQGTKIGQDLYAGDPATRQGSIVGREATPTSEVPEQYPDGTVVEQGGKTYKVIVRKLVEQRS